MIQFTGIHSVQRLLCLGAHSDDIEIGAGGTVLRMLQANPQLEVMWVVLSGIGPREAEARGSAQAFLANCKQKTIRIESFRDAYFPSQLVEIKTVFESLKAFDPQLVLTHKSDDRHQDHRVVNELTWNTFRNHPIWEYEIQKWDGDLGRPNLYLQLEPAIVDQKVKMLMDHFATQRSKHWFDEETFRGLMRIRGLESNTRYAEGFCARKVVI
jgi:LmbE family N-acetylglucosaminyl deacetylase